MLQVSNTHRAARLLTAGEVSDQGADIVSQTVCPLVLLAPCLLSLSVRHGFGAKWTVMVVELGSRVSE